MEPNDRPAERGVGGFVLRPRRNRPAARRVRGAGAAEDRPDCSRRGSLRPRRRRGFAQPGTWLQGLCFRRLTSMTTAPPLALGWSRRTTGRTPTLTPRIRRARGTPKNIAWLPRHSSADPVDANQLRPNTVTYDWVLRRTTKSSPAARCHGSLGRSPSLSLRIGTQSSRPHMPQAQRATQPLHRQNGWTSSYGHVYSPSTRAEKGQTTQWWLAPNRACSALVEQG